MQVDIRYAAWRLYRSKRFHQGCILGVVAVAVGVAFAWPQNLTAAPTTGVAAASLLATAVLRYAIPPLFGWAHSEHKKTIIRAENCVLDLALETKTRINLKNVHRIKTNWIAAFLLSSSTITFEMTDGSQEKITTSIAPTKVARSLRKINRTIPMSRGRTEYNE